MEKFVFNNQEYDVSYDKDELLKLEGKIIENASILKHEDYIGYHSPFDRDIPLNRITNYKRSFAYVDDFGIDCYRFEYDEYKYPFIVKLIDMLLVDDLSALKYIYRPDMSKEVIPSEFEINSILEKLKSSSVKINEKIKLTEKLRELYIGSKYEDDYVTMIESYYFELMNLIDLKMLKPLNRELK